MTGSIRVRLSANQAVWSDQELQTLMDPTVEYSLAHYWKPCSFGLAEAGAILGALLPPGPIPTTAAGGPLDDLFDDRWPQRDLWLSAVRIDDGSRVMFGREGDPVTDVPTAVAASCALPGWFTPVVVDEQWYIDGAMWSATNAEVLAEYDLDGVVISAPLSGWMTPLQRWHRRHLRHEVRQLRSTGTSVMVVARWPACASRCGQPARRPG